MCAYLTSEIHFEMNKLTSLFYIFEEKKELFTSKIINMFELMDELAWEQAHLFGEFARDNLGSRHLRASERNGPRKSHFCSPHSSRRLDFHRQDTRANRKHTK